MIIKHNNHLKDNRNNLIKDTISEMVTKRSMGASKMTVFNIKQPQ